MENKKRLSSIIEQAQAGLSTAMPYFITYWSAYNALLQSDVAEYLKANGKSHLPVHYIMNKLQRIRTDFVEGYFTNKQFANISEKPTLRASYYNPKLDRFVPIVQNTKDMINALQNAVDYYTLEDDNFHLYEKLTQCFDHLTPYGTAALKISWDFNRGGLELENIEVKDIMYDKKASNFYESKYVVHNIYLTREDIEDNQKSGFFDAEFNINDICTNSEDTADKFKRHKLQEVYELKKGKWIVSTIYDKKTILREEKELPFGVPFVVGKLKNKLHNPQENDEVVKIYGDSIIAPLVSIQREMTVIRNQQIDITNRELNPRYITNDRNINPFDFTNQNIQLIQGDPNKFKELKTPDLRNSNFNVDRLSVEGQEAIGVTDYNSGTSNNKQLNDTATGISILTTESNKILAYYMRACNESLIKPLFKKIADLVWAYGDAKFFYGIDRTQPLEYKVGVNVGLGATNPQQQLNAKNTAYQGMLNLAQLKQNPLALDNAEKFYYKEILPLLGVENYEEYLNEQTSENRVLQENAGQFGLV